MPAASAVVERRLRGTEDQVGIGHHAAESRLEEAHAVGREHRGSRRHARSCIVTTRGRVRGGNDVAGGVDDVDRAGRHARQAGRRQQVPRHGTGRPRGSARWWIGMSGPPGLRRRMAVEGPPRRPAGHARSSATAATWSTTAPAVPPGTRCRRCSTTTATRTAADPRTWACADVNPAAGGRPLEWLAMSEDWSRRTSPPLNAASQTASAGPGRA